MVSAFDGEAIVVASYWYVMMLMMMVTTHLEWAFVVVVVYACSSQHSFCCYIVIYLHCCYDDDPSCISSSIILVLHCVVVIICWCYIMLTCCAFVLVTAFIHCWWLVVFIVVDLTFVVVCDPSTLFDDDLLLVHLSPFVIAIMLSVVTIYYHLRCLLSFITYSTAIILDCCPTYILVAANSFVAVITFWWCGTFGIPLVTTVMSFILTFDTLLMPMLRYSMLRWNRQHLLCRCDLSVVDRYDYDLRWWALLLWSTWGSVPVSIILLMISCWVAFLLITVSFLLLHANSPPFLRVMIRKICIALWPACAYSVSIWLLTTWSGVCCCLPPLQHPCVICGDVW